MSRSRTSPCHASSSIAITVFAASSPSTMSMVSVAGHVGERARGRADRERSDLACIVRGERAVAGGEPGRELLPMEPVEVDRRVVQPRVDHGETVPTGPVGRRVTACP